ncbi:MAG: hypothetical protein WD336_12165 [Trueperaceae bacterium]
MVQSLFPGRIVMIEADPESEDVAKDDLPTAVPDDDGERPDVSTPDDGPSQHSG